MTGPDTPARPDAPETPPSDPTGPGDARLEGDAGSAGGVGGVGGVLRDYRQAWTSMLAARTPFGPVAPARPKPKRWLYLMMVVTLAAWAFDAASKGGSGGRTLPATVVGVWRTNARSHSTRRFELRESSLVFQVDTSESIVTTHAIAHVRQVQTAEGTAFSVDYFEDGAAGALLTFEFILRAANPPEIVFPSQKRIVWTLVPSGKDVRR